MKYFLLTSFFLLLAPFVAFADIDEHVVRAKEHCDTMVITANVALFNGGQGKIAVVVRSFKKVVQEAETCLKHIQNALNDKDTNRNIQKEGGKAVEFLKEAIRDATVAIAEGEDGSARIIMTYARKAWKNAKEGNRHAQEM